VTDAAVTRMEYHSLYIEAPRAHRDPKVAFALQLPGGRPSGSVNGYERRKQITRITGFTGGNGRAARSEFTRELRLLKRSGWTNKIADLQVDEIRTRAASRCPR